MLFRSSVVGHNAVRNELHAAASMCDPSAELEPLGLITSHPTLRPADVLTSAALPGRLAALDVGVLMGAHTLMRRGCCLRSPVVLRGAGVRPASAALLGAGPVRLRLPFGGAAPIWCLRAGLPRLRSGPSWCVGPRRLRRLAVWGVPWVWAYAVTRSEVANDFSLTYAVTGQAQARKEQREAMDRDEELREQLIEEERQITEVSMPLREALCSI